MIERTMPCDLEMERAVLGAILLNEKQLLVTDAILCADSFYLEAHREVFRAMHSLRMAGSPIDQATVIAELRKTDRIEVAGGIPYVVDLTSASSHDANVDYYARNVRDMSNRRKAIRASNELMYRCYDQGELLEDILGEHRQEIMGLMNGERVHLHSGADAINDTYSQIEARSKDRRKVTGVGTGLQALDDKLTGFQPGDLIVIAGRSGRGKTALMLNAVTHAMVRDRAKVLIVSLEMTRQQLGMRMISSLSGVDSYKLMTGYVAHTDWAGIGQASMELARCKFWVYDQSLSLTELDALVRNTHEREGGIDLLAVDYLQLVRVTVKRQENRTQEVTEISRSLKALASDLKIPVLALSQINENGEVRESRAIEHDASVVLMVDLKEGSGITVPAEIEIRKNRNGAIAKLEAEFCRPITKFIMRGTDERETGSVDSLG